LELGAETAKMPTLEELTSYYRDKFDHLEYQRGRYGGPEVSLQHARLYTLLHELYGGRISQLVRSGGRRVVELSCGTNITYQLSASRWASEIVMTELTESGLAEVRRWLDSEPGHLDWSPQVRYIAALEGIAPEALEARLRAKITRVVACNVHDEDPLPGERERFDVAFCLFCFEASCTDETNFRSAVNNFCSLLRPGGVAIICGRFGSIGYRVGEDFIPNFGITETLLQDTLETVGMTNVQWTLLEKAEAPAKEASDQMSQTVPDATKDAHTWYIALAEKPTTPSKE